MSEQPQAESKPFDVIEHLEKIQALPVAFTIEGVPGQQCGLTHLKFRCPRCNVPAAVSNPGIFHCPHCGTTSRITAPSTGDGK